MTWKIWRFSLPVRIFIGLLAGFCVGLVSRQFLAPADIDWTVTNILQPLGSVFMRLILMIIVPMAFSAIVLGILELSGHSLGAIGAKTIAWAALFSAVSVALALSLVNFIRPGERLEEKERTLLVADYRAHHADSSRKLVQQEKPPRPLFAAATELIPTNPLADAVNALSPNRPGGGIIGVMACALIVALALRAGEPSLSNPLRMLLENIFGLTMKIVDYAMLLAPYCVFCLGAASAARIGGGLFGTLSAYIICVCAGLLIEGLVFFPAVLWFVARRSPLAFFRGSREAALTAFGTASSNATMPVTMRVAEKELKVPRGIARFVVSLGAACNHNGTALFEAVTVLFIAQLFGMQLTTMEQLQVALLCMVSSIGAGGVPGGGIAMTTMVLVSLGLPAEAIGIVLGVDRILDMSRTALNVVGDLAIAVLVTGRTPGDESAQ